MLGPRAILQTSQEHRLQGQSQWKRIAYKKSLSIIRAGFWASYRKIHFNETEDLHNAGNKKPDEQYCPSLSSISNMSWVRPLGETLDTRKRLNCGCIGENLLMTSMGFKPRHKPQPLPPYHWCATARWDRTCSILMNNLSSLPNTAGSESFLESSRSLRRARVGTSRERYWAYRWR